ncbi:glycerophosphoinositol inositolphosphodiesterase GDPD2 [Megalops cyprinoides]|uniref:glycerophosphoinositol inositolphosphodiesterase GDPD2 n=1 Tax=Megalops cyprinoides TaxID=118141 RepID=UPI0018642FA6|nr:glycerophosphoinositol inositolphosphodiesterase GDPD2 [Megalops cyprinoides]XP_036404203.1 glycerophosphoinositol inositolphosphodiesterase GDPD2 [Megalops cyprinoides]XP_036404204.1 glycerophosphoinositol inositolphosphodiesterase GDPD2 [Megalops cyprinoides]XP_036404205.1 glycerophosphoinositol inositolphosphodiesterase GDPD2 [Megalops cyprinoides]XP_036404206.1 glycerophosphoinositol inositolphosphodiesterase GDPD2 [Megalops cyprinoides]
MKETMPSQDSICRICCRGIYSCHWSQRTKRERRRQRCPCCWFLILSVVSLLTIFWMYVCLMAVNDQDDVNWFAFSKLKKRIEWINWFMVVVVVAAVLVTYCCLLLLFALFQVALREPLELHWIHKVFLFLAVLIIAGGIAGITFKWKEEWTTVHLSLQATAPFLQLGGVVALTLLSSFVFQRVVRSQRGVSRFIIMVAFVVVSAAIFLCPLAITSPCLLDKPPEKPALIGHRGAPMLAPENTLMSFERSVKCDVMAFETDVQVSKDGVPFLMHDDDSVRTTDVAKIFEGREFNKSSSFTWAELLKLNAGEWFIRTDPFGTVSSLSEQEKAIAKNQSIPSLAELLTLAKKSNTSLIFDLKNEAHNNSDWSHAVDTILKSNISHAQVLWLPSTHRDEVKEKAPGFQHVYSNKTQMDLERGNWLNLKYNTVDSKNIKELRARNISVNLWGVNEPWLFSLLWCSGASSVTTNACHRFKDMNEPIWYMSPNRYKIIWISVDVASVLLMLMLFLLQWKHRQRNRSALWNQAELHPFLPSN